MKKFISKKNNVFLNGDVIVKKFTSVDRQQKELDIYKKLDGKLHAPHIISCYGNTVEIEYIDGDTLLDVFISYENEGKNASEIFLKLINWLKRFNDVTGKRFYDVNLRNFIYYRGEVYGIDFEDAADGTYLEDIGKLFAYILTYNPMFTQYKFNLIKALFTEAGYSKEVFAQMEKELNLLEIQRNFKISDISKQFIENMRRKINED